MAACSLPGLKPGGRYGYVSGGQLWLTWLYRVLGGHIKLHDCHLYTISLVSRYNGLGSKKSGLFTGILIQGL